MKTLAIIPAVLLSMFALTTSDSDYINHPLSSFENDDAPILLENEVDVPHLRMEEATYEYDVPRVALSENETEIPYLQAEEEMAIANEVYLYETELEIINLQEEEEIENADLIFAHVELVEMDIPEPEAEQEEEMIFE